MELSIVMIVYNKAREMPFMLNAFGSQGYPGFDWELLIIDDGSTDGTINEIGKFEALLPLKVHRLQHTGNRNFLRNKGASLATGRRIAFLDGDIIPSRAYLREHGSGSEVEVILGSRLNTRCFPEVPELLVQLSYDPHYLETLPQDEDERSAHLFVADLDGQPHKWRFLHSHNVSIPASVFSEVGGFSTDLKDWGADDLELGFRLFEKGLEFRYSKVAGGVHLYHPSSMNPQGYHRNLRLFLEKHPRPEVELLFIEYLLSPQQAFQAFRACNHDPFHVHVAPEHMGLLANKRLLTNHVGGLAGHQVAGLGIAQDKLGEGFDAYVISPRLFRLGPKVILAIIKKGWLAAAEVLVYDPSGGAAEGLSELAKWDSDLAFERRESFLSLFKGQPKPRTVVYFQREHLLDVNMLDSYRTQLIKAIREREDVLVISRGALERSEISGSFLPSTENRREDEFPELIPEVAFVFPRPWTQNFGDFFREKKRVFYENIPFCVRSPAYYRWLESSYDLVLLPCERASSEFLKLTGGKVPVRTLPPAYDPEIFYPAARPRNEEFRILFVSRYPTYSSGFEHLIEAYMGEFRDCENIVLTLLISKPQHISYRNPYLNEAHNNRLSRWSNRCEAILNRPIDRYLEALSLQHPSAARVEVRREDLDWPQLAGMLRQADLVAEPSLLGNVPVATLPALACGTEVMLPSHLLEYFEDLSEGILAIPSKYTSAHLFEFESTNSIDPEMPQSLLNRSMFKLEKDDMARAMRGAYERWKRRESTDRGGISETARKVYGADNVAKRLVKILENELRTCVRGAQNE